MIMTEPIYDPHPLTGALTAIRDAVGWCRPLLGNPDPEMVPAMLDTAAMTSEITTILLHEVTPPPANDDESDVGEALERASELAEDARRHLLIGLQMTAGAQGIITKVAESR
ncbi:hypothetical protein ACFQS1_34525 [Paractinoplanes rhizophilus]|uniref:Uncharacterized protein n=1 Tax=Paractinoplanes rhizophilus TaxID=1416877 RepID=A0ABW2I2M4_9ACTN